MRIIKPGVLPAETLQSTCEKCKCVFEFSRDEVRSSPDPRDIGCVVIQCPCCSKDIYRTL